MNNGKQPITPTMYTRCGDGEDDFKPLNDGQKTGYEVKFGGLTKREYFVAKAMQGFCGGDTNQIPYEMIAKWSVDMADAILIALEENNQ
jgi:hypothetical protein